MTDRRNQLRTLLDAGVPDSVGAALQAAGHLVIYHRDVLPERTPDEVVCLVAIKNDAILIAVDGDMKQYAKRYGLSADKPKKRFENLSVIRLCCNEVLASKRISHSLSLIEHEWIFSQKKKARRLWIDIAAHSIKTHR